MGITNQWHNLSSWKEAPNSEGVYELGNRSRSIVYIGRSEEGLSGRLKDHAEADGRTCIGRDAVYFRYEVTSQSITREKELFRDYKRNNGGSIPDCNTQDPS